MLVEFALPEHVDITPTTVSDALAMVVLPKMGERADVFDGGLVEKVFEQHD